MKNPNGVSLLTLSLILIAGCSKPDTVDRINSPDPGVFLTIETQHGRGAISNDYTKIYAHLENSKKSDRELLLSGEYLENTKVTWLSPREILFCIPDSATDTFHTYITLRAGGVSDTIRSHLQEHCR